MTLFTLGAGEALPETVYALLVILVAAAVVGGIMSRLRLAEIPAYLAAGVIIGPHALGLLPSEEAVGPAKELALILLMFGIGLHLDTGAFRGATRPLVLIGFISTTISAVLCTLAALAFGLHPTSAIAIGMALSMSSTAAVLRLLQQRRELRRTLGRICFSTLIVQDLLVVIMLGALPALAGAGAAAGARAEGGPGSLMARILIAIGGVGLMLTLGRFAFPVILKQAAKGSSEALLVSSAAIGLGAAVAAGALGLSPALGAFIAGFLLSSTPFRYHLSGQLASLRDLFLAIFFTSVGLSVDPGAVAANWWVVATGLVLMLVLKAGSIGLTAWSVGASAGLATACGVYLAQAGEFSLVVLDAAGGLGLVDEASYATVIAIVVLSLMVTPAMISRASWLSERIRRAPTAPWARGGALATPDVESPEPGRGSIIIAGFGPTGRALAEGLDASGARYTIIELNPATVRTQERLGRSIVFGDAANEEVLESAGVREAEAIVFTFPDDEGVLRAARAVRALAPDIFIAARVGYLSRGMLARSIGVDHVVVEELATAEMIQRQVLDILHQRAAEADTAPPDQQ